MSDAFRELLRMVGSGPHTGKQLSREQSADATRMMLLQEATPAQIGAFMIAHRIRRPTGEELAGMLDAYDQLGPKLQPIERDYPALVLCCPYDGRDRTVPVTVLTALIVLAVGCPVVMHGGDRMPTKEGMPLIDLWHALGVEWRSLSLAQVQHVFQQTGLGFVYLPHHFPLAQGLVPFREQIGKRPPFATLELMWCPYAGEANVVSGFVHPPTEGMIQSAFALRGTTRFTTVKGLEGSCDLPRERTGIIGLARPVASAQLIQPLIGDSAGSDQLSHPDWPFQFERLHLHPQDYGFLGKNAPFTTEADVIQQIKAVVDGDRSEVFRAAVWNGGFYLWLCGHAPTIASGIDQAEAIVASGQARSMLKQVSTAVNHVRASSLVK